jgi:hypothetical protein
MRRGNLQREAIIGESRTSARRSQPKKQKVE